MPVPFLDYGVLGVLAFFMYLQNRRQSRQDDRQYTLESNHMDHQTDAMNGLKNAIANNTEASKAVVRSVKGCVDVQNAKDRLH